MNFIFIITLTNLRVLYQNLDRFERQSALCLFRYLKSKIGQITASYSKNEGHPKIVPILNWEENSMTDFKT